MSKKTLTYSYRCFNDRVPQGCPGHEARLDYESVSEALRFADGQGHVVTLQPPQVQSLLHLLAQITEAAHLFADFVRALGEQKAAALEHTEEAGCADREA